jgi:putative intracellular protease/amidase
MKFLLLPIIISIISLNQCLGQRKILIVATSADYRINKPDDHTWGAYTPEIIDFYSKMIAAGFKPAEVDLVSPKGGKIPLAYPLNYSKKMPLSDSDKLIFEQKLNNSLSPENIDADSYCVIYYSGGFSCLVDYPDNEEIAALASKIYSNGGIIAAVCDGVAGLLPIKVNGKSVIAGKRISANKSLKEKLKEKGALESSEKVSTDNHLITAKGVRPESVADAIIELLRTSSRQLRK